MAAACSDAVMADDLSEIVSVAGELGDDHEVEEELMMDWGGIETDASVIELGEGT